MNLTLRHPISRRRAALCAGVSATALLASGALTPALADAASVLSPAALAQATAQRAAAAATSTATNAPLASPALQAQVALSAANLARAAQAIAQQTAAQAAARANSQLTLNNVPLSGSSWNGAPLSGLNPVDDADPTLWINADPLKKDATAATATVKQTSTNAILTWQSLDLNKDETLVFDQQDHSDWTVLNRIVAGPRGADGSRFVASPSTILGKIEAAGAVYVINPNGIIFGPTAQVNVHSLIASSLDVGNPLMTRAERDNFFLNTGILGNGAAVPAASFSYDRGDSVVEGEVRVEAGAVIKTSLASRSISPDAGGFVYLFAPKVRNDGTIVTPAGETMMVAAQIVQLIAHRYPDAGVGLPLDGDAPITFRGVGVNTNTTNGGVAPWRRDGAATGQISEPGSVINNGLIDAERGIVILNGDYVTLGSTAAEPGIIRANTSLTRNSQVYLDARLKMTMQGMVQILPVDNGETIPQSAVSNFNPGSVEMQGVTVDFEPGSLIVAPGASVTAATRPLSAGVYPIPLRPTLPLLINRVYMAPGSVIDVSGLTGVTLPMSANLLTLKPFGNEFADQPLQRQGALRGQDLTIDIRDNGTFNGMPWIGTPLGNFSSFAGNVPRKIDQLLTTGGKVSLTATTGDVVLRQDSAINVGGGYVQYEGGVVDTTRLLTADGRVVDIARASPLDTYIGVAGTSTFEHARWGPTVSETFADPLIPHAQFEPGYIEGRDAGGITLDAQKYVIEGAFYAGAIPGENQRTVGIKPTAATANSTKSNPYALPSAGYLTFAGLNNLIIQNSIAPLAGDFTADTTLPEDRAASTQLDASAITNASFGKISANFTGQLRMEENAVLAVVPGGSIALAGGSVVVAGQLIARSGAITIESTAHIAGDVLGPTTAYAPTDSNNPRIFDLAIGSAARLDASGLWVNDKGASQQDLIGSAFIDGGSIALKTDTRSAACSAAACTETPGLGVTVQAIVDLTGNIVLSSGSQLDVSSGGRVGTLGLVQADSGGRPAGKGGSVTLQTYVGEFSGREPMFPTLAPTRSTILLADSDGSEAGNAEAFREVVSAYGFAKGGTLTIQAPSIRVGGAGSSTPGAFNLPAEFFDGNAYSAYNLSSIADGITVSSGTTLTLRQKNLSADESLMALPTGTRIAEVVGTAYLPDILREHVNLSLSSTLAPLPFTPYDDTIPAPAPATAIALSVEEGAIIQGDPGASISIRVNGRTRFTPFADATFKSPVAAQTAVATILGTVSTPGGTIDISGGSNSRIWLGEHSSLDASGVIVVDTRRPDFNPGVILPGGIVTISGSDVSDSVLAAKGAVIDVSGTAGELDVLSDPRGLPSPRFVWSDGGSIKLTAATLLFDGAFYANPGATEARGGSLTISIPKPVTTKEITVRQEGKVLSKDFQPTDDLGDLAGSVIFQADHLTGSGIADLTLSASAVQGDDISQAVGEFSPGTITFKRDIKLGGLESLFLDASLLSLVDVDLDTEGCHVCLSARYVALRGAGAANAFMPVAGPGRLRVEGDTIDIAAGSSAEPGVLSLTGVASARFISSGDIRLRVPLSKVGPELTPGVLPAGELVTAGNLTFRAQQIYPISNVDITLKSTAPDGKITFVGNGTALSLPLSAGGRLTVSAATIEQSGTLLAPLGAIRLGAHVKAGLSNRDPSPDVFVPTQTVLLAPGSITSVSLSGKTVPFGETANGISWSYDSLTGLPLEAPPAKIIVLAGGTTIVAGGATLDARGGGDIQAMEFVPGIGGTRDVLALPDTYAIIPGYNPSAAPLDLAFILQKGDHVPAAGLNVYLTGGPGLPAGYYTLLPPHYATLPGAYRVSLVTGSQDASSTQNAALSDGTVRMAGFFARPASGTRDSTDQFFDVQSSAVWRQYSEILQTSGNQFFGTKTAVNSDLPPRLPMDAGHVVFHAVRGIGLDGMLKLSAAEGGRGAEVDLAADIIRVISGPGSDYALNAKKLSNLGAESLLLGGVRNEIGGKISVSAGSVEIENDETAPLQAPEIILVADGASGHAITLRAGSVVSAVGTLPDARPQTVTIGDEKRNIPGNGSLLAVSNGTPLNVARENVDVASGLIILEGSNAAPGKPAAALKGKSLTLDSAGGIRVNAGVALEAEDISIGARSINLGEVTGTPGGLVASPELLAQLEKATTLTLRSATQAINFYGAVDLALSKAGSRLVLDAPALFARGPGAVTLSASEVEIINSRDIAPVLAAGSATLQVDAASVELGMGDKGLSGFTSASFNGSSEVAVRDEGSFNAGAADLNFQTPLFLVGTGARQTITTTGIATFFSPGATQASSTAEIGGTLTVNAGSISGNALIQATAGGLTLHATSGDIVLGANAKILANGSAQEFFDVTRVAYGGTVQLIADQGSIDTDAASSIDVSSAASHLGYAGTVTLRTPNGSLLSNGGAFSMTVLSGSTLVDSGGSLILDAQTLGTTSLGVPPIFSDSVDIRVRQGDLQLAQSMKAANVTLTADKGALTIAHTIDASGKKGGTISLYGGTGVVLASGGELLATASSADKSGGEVIIGTSTGSANGSGAAGIIDLQSGIIDVSNTAGAANGGTVRLRAPLIGSDDDVAINSVVTEIRGARRVTVEAFKVFDTDNSAFDGIIDPIAQPDFYGSCSVQSGSAVCSGTLVQFVRNFSLSSTAQQKFASIPVPQLHLQPGIELVNNDPTVNNGDITVANNWNLGAGFAGYLVNADQTILNGTTVVAPGTAVVTDQNGALLPEYASYPGRFLFVPGVSTVAGLYYRVGGSPIGEASTLTLRATRDVNVNASITDGFFSERNTLDQQYYAALAGWLSINSGDVVGNVGGYVIAGARFAYPHPLSGPLPLAPYDRAANDISPVFGTMNPFPITGADLFPLLKDDDGPIVGADGNYRAIDSWSYRIVGGADIASANPLAVRPLAEVTGYGDVAIDGHQEFDFLDPVFGSVTPYRTPTIVRTGTGSIDIAAARDFKLLDHDAPGVVYTAGRNSTALPDPGFVLETVEDPSDPTRTITIPVATNPTGFLAPQVLSCSLDNYCNPYGALTQAAYPVGGGHLTLTAQRDIIGFEHPVIDVPNFPPPSGEGFPNQQYFAPWLLAQGTPLPLTDFGQFSPLSGYLAAGGFFNSPSQTSWWINFGSFDQGVMSVGGDVRVEAGRDIRELSVSLPTTARFSGGLSSAITDANGKTVANIPVAHVNGSGDLTVIAGRDLKSGAYYEGSGEGKISVGGSVSASWAFNEPQSGAHDISTVLALDTGVLSLYARGTVDIAGVVSGASLQNVADPTGSGADGITSRYLSTYGPSSSVTLQSVAGDTIANSLDYSLALITNLQASYLGQDTSAFAGVNRYPANLEATALRGNVQIADPLRLAPSQDGTLDLLAYDSLEIFTKRFFADATLRPWISTGPSLIEQVFDPVNPIYGFAPPQGSPALDVGAILLHENDATFDHVYAATGDIVSGAGPSTVFETNPINPLSLEVTKPSKVRAAGDIVDLSFFGQNLAPTDVTSIVAGRDLYYTGAWQAFLGQGTQNEAGLSLAGPGFFAVEAGRNLGPFVTSAADIAAGDPVAGAESDSTGTGIITFGNTLVAGNRRMTSSRDLLVPDQFALSANEKLPRQGADIVVQFGVGNGVDYQAVIASYIDPATSTSTRDYTPALQNYLRTLGLAPTSSDEAWSMFQFLSQDLQNIFVGRIFFSELRVPGDAEGPSFKDYEIGYSMISTLFPASLGYTDNGSNSANRIVTGSLDLLHATIKTLQSGSAIVQDAKGKSVETAVGGDITVFGPGGDIDVGTTAVEINKKLSNSAVGVLTLDNGVINTFTDGSVLVNQSRILTVQGGDIVMWSSNKDLDAGRGAKTTVDFKPLSVEFAPNDLQTLNLNGLVSGAGIGTIQSTPDAPPASAFLIAPRGIVNAGDAGLRSSGNISIAALLVLNAANITIAGGGDVAGLDIAGVNLGALESTAAVAGQAAQAAEEAVAAATNRAAQTPPPMAPSLITVEVFIGCDPESGMTCAQQ